MGCSKGPLWNRRNWNLRKGEEGGVASGRMVDGVGRGAAPGQGGGGEGRWRAKARLAAGVLSGAAGLGSSGGEGDWRARAGPGRGWAGWIGVKDGTSPPSHRSFRKFQIYVQKPRTDPRLGYNCWEEAAPSHLLSIFFLLLRTLQIFNSA